MDDVEIVQTRDADQAAEDMVALIRTLLPQVMPAAAGPTEIHVSLYRGGSGTGMAHGVVVNIESDPRRRLSAGDVVVGVPIKPATYYVVGKK